MSWRSWALCTAAILAANAWSQEAPAGLVFVKGGTFGNPKSRYHAKETVLPDFYIGKYEVTQREWIEVMGNNPSEFKGDLLPVENVSWYDCIEYCNRRSVKEGLSPYYHVTKDREDPNNDNADDGLKWIVTINAGANGYRLPTEVEWEYAAGGGQVSRGHVYSGSDEVDKVAWYWQNSGDKYLAGTWSWPALEQNNNRTKPVGNKEPNELGLYDMSGNVREWCWDWFGNDEAADHRGAGRGVARVWKGGGWMGADFCCEPSFRAGYEPHGRGTDQGFRVCRDK